MPPRITFPAWVLAVATAMWSTACEPWRTPAPPAPPRIVYDTTTHDFGHAGQGTAVRHVFALQNAGGRDLRIDRVRAGCGCTAEAATLVVAPAGAGAIEVTCATKDDFGSTTRTVAVYSNDPAQPVSTLTLRGEIDADVAADPPQLYIGRIRRGQTAPNAVRVAIATATTVVALIEPSGAVVEPVIEPAAPGGLERRVRVGIKSDAPLGRFTETVAVRTSSAQRPLLAVPVTGIVEEEASPSGRGGDRP
jgi:hypothetical protein